MHKRNIKYRNARVETKIQSENPDYGKKARQPDMSSEIYMDHKNVFLQKNINISQEIKDKIEYDTRNQSSSDEWFQRRRIRITTSKVGEICGMRPITSCKNLV